MKLFSKSRPFNLRYIANSPILWYQPGEQSVRKGQETEKIKHRFVPCCEALMTKIDSKLDPLRVKPEWEQPKVVIVGAGMAGLSAAASLAQGGIKNIVILEAKQRAGGRIHSCRLGNVTVELGSEFIEGSCIANPVYNLACMGRVILCSPERYKPYPEEYVTYDGRTIIPETNVAETINEILFEAAGIFTSKKDNYKNTNLEEFIMDRLTKKLYRDLNPDQRYDFLLIANGILNQIRTRWGADLSMLSLEQYGSQLTAPGGDIRLLRGASTILDPLISELPQNCIKYGKPVQCIRWSTVKSVLPRAVVSCCDGTDIDADYVICTVSLGVLKEYSETLFQPRLPGYKRKAIESLGYGNVNKIFVEYDRPFWVKAQETKLKIAWATDQLKIRDNWVKGIGLIQEVKGRGNVLMCVVSGKEAVWTEEISDLQLAEEFTIFLRQVTGDPSIPCPIRINRSKWKSDVNFYGARTYMKVGSLPRHNCDLAVPLPGLCVDVPPIICFAGEATVPGHSSTMNGARISGIREAHRILGLTMEFHGPPRYQHLPPEIPSCDSWDTYTHDVHLEAVQPKEIRKTKK
ncbi:hypothetical protein O3M35_013171 [Rhynocoris fuscipes]|uniref:Amine oxidase domain-containing protein n=1 Tax=Rhynocoris fuscipes TaxID=488301 RepID=A0AAW1CEY5_9HEMI